MSQGHRRDRKKRRLLYGAAAAVVATATIGTIAVASPGVLGSEDGKNSGNASLQSQFAEAAREFDVPQSVLMAVSYRQTRWESHDGLPSTTGAYNVMGLTDVDADDVEHEDDKERLSHLNRSGRAEIEKTFDAAKVLRSLPKETVDTDDPRLHTLDKAAELIDSSAESVKNDTAESIRAGAALLAEYQRQATGELPDDPGQWYAGVARYSQSPDKKGADLFAKRVFESIRTGERELTTDGEQVVLPADPSVEPVKPSNVPLAATFASTTDTPAPECPSGLNCNFVPSRTASDGKTRNYTLADRPNQGVDIRQIVIHDTEGSYEGSLATLTNPDVKASAHYLVRAHDGLVTQMVENKHLAWHAGNWTLNMHSIGVEHEGYAIKQGSWYTESQYESTAALVKFLAAKYGIPLDREHIIGHDELPVQLDSYIPKTHWDPGPFWDWNRFMSLVGAPTGASGAGGPVKVGQVVRFVPPFTTANQPKLTVAPCDSNGVCTDVPPQPANFGYLYTSPSTTASTVGDQYFSAVWSQGSNWGNKIRAGATYVVAGTSGNDWTAIWYGAKKAWFYNPGGQYTVPVTTTPTRVKAKAGVTARVYGRSFPETAAYTAAGLTAPTDNPNYLSKYPLTGEYAKVGAAVKGDDWFGSAQKNVIGNDVYIPIHYNHRQAYVKASEVDLVPGVAPDAGTNRYNLLARDSSGVLWQYQGTGSASEPFYSRYRVGSGWNAYNLVTPLTALGANGTGDVIAREPSGALWYYSASGNPSAPFKARVKAGTGWGVFNQIVGVRDQTGDGKPDVIGREPSGVLWLYPGTGNPSAPLGPRLKIGTGWQTYNMIISTGDLTGDGKPDLMGRDTAGALWLYNGTGVATQPFGPRVKIGTGWQTYNTILGPSDLNRDGRVDVIARDGSGALWLYTGSGNATSPFPPRVKVGSGWQIYNMIF
ncbi:N-acetylmuramoyl-L-alanine amidase [Streptomyces sp. NPDC015346]|uniref:N-acetylmuramoyl-L-alanine amidase n=1 Tax=Streptomyces sp. NPDC015346 TaxID=3364954 RepID=UPI0036FA6A15